MTARHRQSPRARRLVVVGQEVLDLRVCGGEWEPRSECLEEAGERSELAREPHRQAVVDDIQLLPKFVLPPGCPSP